MFERRVTDYDAIAGDYDARYDVYDYGGVGATLVGFLGDGAPLAILEVGCGTGHWLAEVQARLTPSPYANDDARSRDANDDVRSRDANDDVRSRDANDDGRSRDANDDGRSRDANDDVRSRDANDDVRSHDANDDARPPYAGDDASSPSIVTRSAKASAERHLLAGVDPSAPMLARARLAAPAARLVRARAEDLPWRDGTFDRIFCVNALHHFADRARFFEEARRLLRPGGGLLTIGKDPHVDQDSWWVYDYFTETREIDKGRYARVRTLRGEMAHAGFAWADSHEADRIEAVRTLSGASDKGMIARSFTSQLTVLTDDEFNQGLARLRAADAAAGGELQLVTDFKLYATVGWV